MLAVLRERAAAEHLEIEVIQASAEATGLSAASFDAALAGEAYHWFDAPAALAEMSRIVRPGGGIAFFWNVGETGPSPLVAGERRLVAEYGIDGSDVRKPGPLPETRDAVRDAGAFDEPEFHQVRHVVPMSGSDYLGLAYTKSHLRTAPAELQERYRDSFIEMMTMNGVDLDDRLDIPYVVDCWIARRSAA
jgi:SAM-dependent methyltransferase